MKFTSVLMLVVLFFFLPILVQAHCDTMDGPVIATAKAALEKGDVLPILKWVQKQDENEIRDLFRKTMTVRSKGKDAQDLADRFFFETVVRIHRAGEGEPFTGIKPGGHVEPSIAAADRAIETGSVDSLVKTMNDASTAGLRKRYLAVAEARKHADESVDAGRKFVAAYVDFTHYVEKLDQAASGSGYHGAQKMQGHQDHEAHSSAHLDAPRESPATHHRVH